MNIGLRKSRPKVRMKVFAEHRGRRWEFLVTAAPIPVTGAARGSSMTLVLEKAAFKVYRFLQCPINGPLGD